MWAMLKGVIHFLGILQLIVTTLLVAGAVKAGWSIAVLLALAACLAINELHEGRIPSG